MKIDKITIAMLSILAALFLIGVISLIVSIVTGAWYLILRDAIVAAGGIAIIALWMIQRKLDE